MPVLTSEASVLLDGEQATAHPGDAIVVPAGIPFEVANDDDSVLRLLCFTQAGGQAWLADGTLITPPWAQ